MVSTDRARVLAGLELLNKLAQNENNEDILLKALELKVRFLKRKFFTAARVSGKNEVKFSAINT